MLPSGAEIALDTTVIVGRNPGAPRISVGPAPRLVSLPSPTRGFAWRPLPEAFRELFVAREALRPFCAKLNAWVTGACSGWLMGRSKLEDADPADIASGWGDGRAQVLKVERCRFLEASGCASTCINMCKAPTQTFGSAKA